MRAKPLEEPYRNLFPITYRPHASVRCFGSHRRSSQPSSFTTRLRRPHQDDAATDARLCRSTPEFRSSPPPLKGAPSPLNTTTTSTTRHRTCPSPHFHRGATGEPPPSTPEPPPPSPVRIVRSATRTIVRSVTF
ncbi:uncharacterized protein [Triticum aestivum]|uniref:uncharacterized protein n=1 Tax=Triticum aestivum TaxID=4565 RepID=UPI001D0126E9|nr:uncharacterized protein LOC123058436 [Triticum aestivum]